MPKSRLNGFDTVAGLYDVLARLVYGKSIRDAQLHFLGRIPAGANVLILGGGTGWLLRALLDQNADCTVWYVEASAKMLEASRKAAGADQDRVQFVHGTEQSIPTGLVVDAIVTNFYLDLFAEASLPRVVKHLLTFLRHGGLWLACDFVNTGKIWHRTMLTIMILFFRITAGIEAKTLADWQGVLLRSGVRVVDWQGFYRGFIVSSAYDYAPN